MKSDVLIQRRSVALGLSAWGLGLARGAAAQSAYPARPITLVVPYAAGGVTDVLARHVGNRITDALKQPVIVENRAGAAGSVGSAYVSRAKPDGYTLLVANQAVLGIDPVMRTAGPYDPLKDFTPITAVVDKPLYLIVSEKSSMTDFASFLAAAKASAGKWAFGTAGVGSWSHFIVEQLRLAYGFDAVHVPYKGGSAALTDLIGGQIQFMMDPAAFSGDMGGKIRIIASTGQRRFPGRENIPTFKEQGFDMVAEGWTGIVGPPGMPRGIRDMLAKALTDAAADPSFGASLAKEGFIVAAKGPDELARRMRVDIGLFEDVKRKAGIKGD